MTCQSLLVIQTWARRARIAAIGTFLVAAAAGFAFAANPAPVQLFYVPFPEDQLLQGLRSITGTTTPTDPITTYVSIAAVADNTIIYYDQWENGYDADIANPANLYSGGNPGGTQIWGDNDPTNGAPPPACVGGTNAGSSCSVGSECPGGTCNTSDLVNAGRVIILKNDVVTTNLSAIDFDGRDKLAATKTVAVSHTAWAAGSGTLLAGSVEVFDTNSWGTDYRAPVGANIPDGTDFQMFEYTSLAILAGEGGATVQIDKDANGVFETTQVLSEGQSYFVNGGVNVGGRIVSDKPVQVDILTGDIGSTYESRDSALLPVNFWSTSSYEPVSTASTGLGGIAGTDTTVWLYNPGASPLTVAYTTRNGGGALTTTNLSVPGGAAGGYLKQVIPDGYGARFTAASAFYAFSTTNSTDSTHTGTPDSNANYTGNQAWDWGFTLVPEDSLTPQVLIGLGIGRDPTSGTNPTENGNPVWVTPFGNGDTPVTVYVDFDANPATGALTDPNGNKYDQALSLKELERAKVYDTSDRNQTGTLLYTLTAGVKLAAAWGQDPTTASASAPGLDVGTGVPPLPLFSAGKNGTLFTDNDGDGFVSPGDVVLYTIPIANISRAPVPNILLIDTLPVDTTYVPNSTFFTNAALPVPVTTQIPDDGSGTAFPLDGSGRILDNVTALRVGGSYSVTFKVTIDSFANLTPGTTEILNVCSVSAVGVTVPCVDRTPLNGCIGDFVWNDIDGDAVQDGGGEAGIPAVQVRLVRDANGNGIIDGGELVVATQTTDGSGGYRFNGVVAGTYLVDVVDATVPVGYVATTTDPRAITLAGGQCNAASLTADFGYMRCGDGVVGAGEDCDPGIATSVCCSSTCHFLTSATTCRGSAGICDVPEVCSGSSASCPADGFSSSATVCRSSVGVCDVVEHCTGSSAACPADGFASSSTVCRSSAGVCDVVETCTGSSAACPADLKSTSVCRAAAGACDVAETCNGVSNGCPADTFAGSGTVCRASAGVCDVAETCTGASANCPTDGFASAATICRASAGVCDVQENCTGASALCPADAKSTAVCRASAGTCDVVEVCDGVGNACPSDGFASAATVCRAAAGVCDLQETCTGATAACPTDAKSTAVCRAAAGACDEAESCNGVANTCPPDGFASASTVCRAAAGVCDLEETCTGSSAACPADAKSTAVCRAAAGVCDVAESCSGGNDCPADAFASASTVCRAAVGVCDLQETCTGSSATCPADAKSTAQCRAAAGVCDTAETCDGVSNACPADAFLGSATVCRAAAGVCDVAEHCTGTSAPCPSDAKSASECRAAVGVCDVAEVCDNVHDGCPADVFEPSAKICRAAAGSCDVAEHCTGTDGACPSDTVVPAGTECRAAAGSCDVAEHCDGAAVTCPVDGFQGAGVTCRAAAGVCDVGETCTGTGADCPSDSFVSSATVCRPATDVCDAVEYCPGSAANCPSDGVLPATTVCRASAGACDAVETCTGDAKTCPVDAFDPSGTPCEDGSFCTMNDTCDANGSCDGAAVSCDDVNPCTDDSCDSQAGGFLCEHVNNGTCIGPNCGNAVVDAGETCDPPNLAPGPNGQTLCRLDCTSCGDGVVQANDVETCDDGNLVSGCRTDKPQKPLDDCLNNCNEPICADPAKIKFGSFDQPDSFSFHGRLISDVPVDFANNHFVIELQTVTGEVVYRASLVSGSIEIQNVKSVRYKNRGARDAGGVYQVKIKAGEGYYMVSLKAYGDLSNAVADMSTHAYVGSDEWVVRGLWTKQGTKGWKLSNKEAFLPVQ